MKAIRIMALIALIAAPSSSYAWSRGRAVVVRSGFPGRVAFVRPGFNRVVFVRPFFPGTFVSTRFVGGLATGIVLNPFFFPRSFYFPGPLINYYPPSSVFASTYYPRSYAVAPPPPPADPYDRGYSEGYAQGYEEALRERDKERYEEGKKRGYEEGYEAGKGVRDP